MMFDFNSGYNIDQHSMREFPSLIKRSVLFHKSTMWIYACAIILVTMLVLVFIQDVFAVVFINRFTAESAGDSILLEWSTLSETNNVGFYIQRSSQETGPFTRQSPYFPTLSESGAGEEYFWFDTNVNFEEVYFYRLEAIDNQGISQYFGPIAGSLTPGLITATVSVSLTATQTPPPGSGMTPTPTTTRILSIATSTPTPTGSLSLPTSTGTPNPLTPEGTLADTFEADGTITPTLTLTLEPLPTIELIFPATETPERVIASDTPVLKAEALSAGQAAPSGVTEQKLPSTLIGLIGVVSVLWICLGGLLFFLVRKLSD